MAEQLGEASLRLTLDTKGLDEALKAAKAKIEGELGGTIEKAAQKQTGQKPGGTAGGLSAELKASAKILALRNSINILETKGSNVSQFRARLAEIEAAAANRQFRSVAQQGEVLRQLVSAEQNRLKVTKNITTENEKQRRQQIKIARENAVPVSGVIKTPGLPAFQFPGSPGIRGGRPQRAVEGVTAAAQTQVTRSAERAAAAERKLAADREKTAQATARAAARERKQAADRRRDIISNVAIGAGFPLLFGQGFGAAGGGALGGGVGALFGGTAGFAGSIVGTAIGAAVDNALLKLQELAKGLENPITNFEALRQASLLSSRALEKQVEGLIASGRTTEAELLIRQDLNTLLGDTTAATEYLNSVDRLNRAWARGTTILAQFTAKPLADFIDFFAEPIQGLQLANTFEERASRLNPRQQEQLRRFQRQQSAELPTFRSGAQINEAYIQLLQEIARITGEAAKAEKDLLAVREAGIKATQAQARARIFGAFGVEGLAASAELQSIRESQNALVPRFTDKTAQEQERIVQELRQKNLQTAQQIVDLRNQEITAAAKLLQLDEQREQRNEALVRSIGDSTQLLSVQPGVYRDNLRFVQQIRETLLSASDAQETNLRNLQVARDALGEPTQANAVDRERLLAQERQVRLEYVDAAAQVRLSLIEAAERLRDSFRDAALRFTEIRASAQGLNRFLTPQQREGRALADFDILLPLFRAAQRRFTELTGVPARELVAPSQEALNAGIRDFIDAVNAEEASGRILVDSQKALRDVNQGLVNVNERLISATQTLADKNWVVDVQVVNQAGGATTVNAINALSQ